MTNEITRLEAENGVQAEEITRLSERAKAAESRGEELRQELAQLHARFQEVAGQPKAPKASGSRKKAGQETV